LVQFSTSTFTGGTPGGAITFANPSNTLATAGASLDFEAGTDLTMAHLDSGGGDVQLSASGTGAGTLSAPRILTAGLGNILWSATNSLGGTTTQTGPATGLAISIRALGNITVDSLSGTSVTLANASGSISSTGGNPIQASDQLTLSAGTGITVN